MGGKEIDNPETVKWDPNFTELARKAVAPSSSSGSAQRCGTGFLSAHRRRVGGV